MEIDPEVKKNIFESNDTWSASGLLFASRTPLLHSPPIMTLTGFPAERRSL